METVIAANNLFARYAHAADRGTVDEVLEVFTDDVIVYPNTAEGHLGQAAARAVYEGIFSHRADLKRTNQHQVSTVRVGGGKTPEAVAYFHVAVVGEEADGSDARSVFGRYETRLSTSTMSARFSEFRIVITHTVSHGAPVAMR